MGENQQQLGRKRDIQGQIRLITANQKKINFK